MRKGTLGSVNHLFQLPVLGVGVAIVGLLAYRQVARVARPNPYVVIARSALAAGTVVQADDVKQVRRPEKDVPRGAFDDTDDVNGKRLVRAKERGDPLGADDFGVATSDRTQALAQHIPEGRVLTTLTIQNITIPHRGLRQGDRVDVLVAGQTPDNRRAARIVVRDAFIVGYVTPTSPRAPAHRGLLGIDRALGEGDAPPQTALLLALKPEDVLPIAEIDGAGAHLSLVLHSSTAEGEPLTVAGQPNPKAIDVIIGANRQRVIVR